MDWKTIWKRKYATIIFLAIVIRSVNVQFAMPMFPSQPQMFAMGPSPIQIAVMPISLPKYAKKTTPKPSTTTESPAESDKNGIAVAIPVPMPMPLQMAFPAQAPPPFCASRPKPVGCPPCPPCVCGPSCTPSFFSYCSPCHQKCRCKDRSEAPIPMPPMPPYPAAGPAFPIPMPMGPSAVIVPVPPFPRIPQTDRESYSKEDKSTDTDTETNSKSYSSEEDSTDSDSSDTDDYYRRSRKKHHRKLKKLSRRKLHMSRRSMGGNLDVIKPVLSFINKRGNVKLKKKLTDADVEELLSTSFEPTNKVNDGEDSYIASKPVQNVKVLTVQDDGNPQITVLSDVNEKEEVEDFRRSNRKMVLKDVGKQSLKRGRKELIFKPPKDKTISNLSLSFSVS